ncbi:MAG: type I restriction-modification system subunit M N-terminal domain-containing protein [Verrucomicrobiales bacterium]|nr:type I restriction-modification system subunit M N-terminal domain-containing protein [Verrucomicrobiae bacterium]
MARQKSSAPSGKDSTANLGFEPKLWLAADKLRNNMDAAEPERSGDCQPQAARRASKARQYKHVVLGLIFLKYISDTAGKCRMANTEIRTRNARPLRHSKFVLRHLSPPADARWFHLQANAKQPTIGKTVDDAMVAIERDNPRLKGVLPKGYARPGLDKHRSQMRYSPDRRAVVAGFATTGIERRLNP